MVRKKKELVVPNKYDRLLEKLNAHVKEGESRVYKASEITSSWRYVDFVNPVAKLPCISLEWLMGARGLLAGRIAQLRATYSKGKSSFMFLMYAAAQLTSKAFCYHIETEGAASPPDYMASFGCDVDHLYVEEVASLEKCLDKIDRYCLDIRGGRGGSISAEGRQLKTTFVDPVDPAMESPILIGVDSLSSLGLDNLVDVDVADLTATPPMAQHTRKLREYFRDRAQRFKELQALVMLTSHQTAKIETGRSFGSGDKKSALAQEAIGIHATYVFDISSTPFRVKSDKDAALYSVGVGETIGDVVTMHTHKNKISPRGRELSLYLVWNRGFDLIRTDVDFLLNHPGSPFTKEECYRHGKGISCKLIGDMTFTSDEEFLRAYYNNQDLVMSHREKMRIRGCGFKFETMYTPSVAEVEDNKDEPETEGKSDGVEGSAGPVQEAGDAH